MMKDNADDLIRTLRRRLGMTQETFAHALDVTVSTVNRWENAHSAPSNLAWRAVRDLARHHGLIDDLFQDGPAVGQSVDQPAAAHASS
jgi:DNA-binding transcriptional regulator YiaG